MPRKEKILLEERLQQARDTYIRKQEAKDRYLVKLASSRIYKLARRSGVLFLWMTQLIFIDWILPYTTTADKIKNGYQIRELNDSIHLFKEGSLNIVTFQNHKLELALEEDNLIPEINDS